MTGGHQPGGEEKAKEEGGRKNRRKEGIPIPPPQHAQRHPHGTSGVWTPSLVGPTTTPTHAAAYLPARCPHPPPHAHYPHLPPACSLWAGEDRARRGQTIPLDAGKRWARVRCARLDALLRAPLRATRTPRLHFPPAALPYSTPHPTLPLPGLLRTLRISRARPSRRVPQQAAPPGTLRPASQKGHTGSSLLLGSQKATGHTAGRAAGGGWTYTAAK